MNFYTPYRLCNNPLFNLLLLNIVSTSTTISQINKQNRCVIASLQSGVSRGILSKGNRDSRDLRRSEWVFWFIVFCLVLVLFDASNTTVIEYLCEFCCFYLSNVMYVMWTIATTRPFKPASFLNGNDRKIVINYGTEQTINYLKKKIGLWTY